MKTCSVYILSSEGPDKDKNIKKKGPNEGKWILALLDSLDIIHSNWLKNASHKQIFE